MEASDVPHDDRVDAAQVVLVDHDVDQAGAGIERVGDELAEGLLAPTRLATENTSRQKGLRPGGIRRESRFFAVSDER